MCYFLYGALWGDISESEYVDIKNKYGLKISLGTKHDVKNAVIAAAEYVKDDYRITDWICDCDSPVGKHDPGDPMIVELGNLITELAALPDANNVKSSDKEAVNEARIAYNALTPHQIYMLDNSTKSRYTSVIDAFDKIAASYILENYMCRMKNKRSDENV